MAAYILSNDEFEYTIGEHYLSAIFNGDDSGLEDDEIEELDSFMDRAGHGVWAMADDESESYFGECDICGLHANVVDMKFIPYIEEEAND